MTTRQSQAITELFNIKTSLQSMKGESLETHHEAIQSMEGRDDHHPMDASRNPELFSELCC
jgi:hypothetical protein